MTLTSLIAALAVLAFSDPVATEPVVSVSVELNGPTATAEYFLLSEPVADAGEEEGAPLAVVALRSIDHSSQSVLPGAKKPEIDFLLEREVIFATGALRVRHTETGHGATRRLVWREFLPKESRTWVADWTAGVRGAEAHSIGYGWNRPVHERVMNGEVSDTTVYGPLELLYGMRDGSLPCGEAAGVVGVIDPASASIVQVERTAIPSGVASAEVAIDLRRADGTLLMGADTAMVEEPGPRPTAAAAKPAALGFKALRLSDRPTVARRIGRKEFDRLSRRWTVESRRPYDAILAQIPKRR